jgi:hypothetical protein
MNTLVTTHFDAVQAYRQGIKHMLSLRWFGPNIPSFAASLNNLLWRMPEDLQIELLVESAKRRSDDPRKARQLRTAEARVNRIAIAHDRRMSDLTAALTTLRAVRLSWVPAGEGVYEARTRFHHFDVTSGNGSWVLTSDRVVGRREPHASLHVTEEQARAAAQAFVDLGDDYRPADHDGRSRWSEAIWRACVETAR